MPGHDDILIESLEHGSQKKACTILSGDDEADIFESRHEQLPSRQSH